jgi:predicted HTH transcriptional regulator
MELFIFVIGALVGGFAAGLVVGKRKWASTAQTQDGGPHKSYAMMTGAAPAFDAADDELLSEARAAVQGRIEKRLDRIMEQAKTKGRIANDGVEELFCISDRTASNYLRTLTDDGRLERKGVGRGTYYTPIE